MIDTRRTYNRLVKLFTPDQADILTETLKETDADNLKNLVTKEYLDSKLSPLDIQIKIAIGLGVAIFIKSFF
jgi:hypothetical protein